MRSGLFAAVFWLLLVAAPQPVEIIPTLATAPVAQDPDDPAVWIDPSDPAQSRILATDKTAAPQGALYLFDLQGRIVETVSGLDRPNNVDVEYGLILGGEPVDIAVVTERLQRRLRVFRIPPEGKGLVEVSPPGGLPVFAGEKGERSAPMGIALYRRPADGAVFAVVGRKEGPRNGYLWQYRLQDDGRGRVEAQKVREFGSFSGRGEIEAIAVDDALGYVYYADEADGIHKWHADPDHPEADRELARFGTEGFQGDREGIAIYALPDGTGYIVCTDQLPGNSEYRIFLRQGEPGNPHDHSRLVKVVRGGADATDGIEVAAASLGARFPFGLLVAMNSRGRNFLLFGWEAVAVSGEPKLGMLEPGRFFRPFPSEPADYRLRRFQERTARFLSEEDEEVRIQLVRNILREEGEQGVRFLLSRLASEPSVRVRREMIRRLGDLPSRAVRDELRLQLLRDPEVELSVLALEKLRQEETRELEQLLLRRLERARQEGDSSAIERLAEEHERWISLVRGTMLPGFLREVPPLFSLKPAGEKIRVLAFGDFGRGGEDQARVASAMQQYHGRFPFDFGITLGDNFYNEGMYSPRDPRWEPWWERLYGPLGIQIYATLGNHDWGHPDSPAAEVLYGMQSPSWRMPAPYYSFTAGPVQFFGIDSNELSEKQLRWLERELEGSDRPWKVVYGHHPVYSAGAHQDNPRMIARLLPVLEGRAQVYLAGHDHDFQHLWGPGGLHLFIAGGGGASIRPVEKGPRSLFARSSFGFAVLEADSTALTVRFVDTDLNEFYTYRLQGEPISGVSASR